MGKVYGWDVADGPGDFFHYTVEHLFADIWNRPGLDTRDRRLLLVGMLALAMAVPIFTATRVSLLFLAIRILHL